MSYGRILKPRIYVCHAAHQVLRGVSPASIIDLETSTLNTGSDERDLLALRPQAVTSFDCGSSTTHIVLSIDLQVAQSISFVAMLNHNLGTADSIIRIAHRASGITGAGQGTAVTPTYLVGTKDEVSGYVTSDGNHLLTFEAVSERYWAVEIEDNAAFAADANIGSILIGTYWDAPYSPDLEVVRRFDHGGVDIIETRGGRRHANVAWLAGSEGSALPYGAAFRRNEMTTATEEHTGRRIYEMTFSRLADTAVDPSNLSDDMSASATWRSVVSRTGGGALPCIFTPDGTSTVAGDYMLARVYPGEERQVAPKVWTVSARIEEEF